MANQFAQRLLPDGSTKYPFFGGKGGVGKTSLATATAVWFADHGYRTQIVSTDPTVSLSAVFAQRIGGEGPVPVRTVPNLCGMNINPTDARGGLCGTGAGQATLRQGFAGLTRQRLHGLQSRPFAGAAPD